MSTRIDPGWRISAAPTALLRTRLCTRWFADLAYLDPNAFDDATVAQHVARIRGYRSPNEAIEAAREVAADLDRRYEAQVAAEVSAR